MSGFVKSVKKVFKKVVKAVKKFLPAILAVGAVVFTAGAALGLAPMAAGWGGAVSSLIGSTGATGTIGTILTGAVTQAGYGAAIGGVASLATGGDPMKGMQMGALGGAATGGVAAGLGYGTDALGGLWDKGGAGTVAGGATQGGVAGGSTGAGVVQPAAGLAPTASAAGVGTGASGLGAGATAAGGSMFDKLLSSPVVGNVVSGLGSGLMKGMDAKAQADAADEERKRLIASYKGLNIESPFVGGNSNRPTPQQRWGTGQYAYNKDTGQIEYVDPNMTA